MPVSLKKDPKFNLYHFIKAFIYSLLNNWQLGKSRHVNDILKKNIFIVYKNVLFLILHAKELK